MSDINNGFLNPGGSSSSSSYNQQSAVNNANANINAKVNTETGDSGSGYNHSWRRAPRPFGLNVRVPQAPQVVGVRTQALIKRTLINLATAPVKPIIEYFKDNEKVFNGSIRAEIEGLEKQQSVTISLLQDSDEMVLHSEAPSFMMDM